MIHLVIAPFDLCLRDSSWNICPTFKKQWDAVGCLFQKRGGEISLEILESEQQLEVTVRTKSHHTNPFLHILSSQTDPCLH